MVFRADSEKIALVLAEFLSPPELLCLFRHIRALRRSGSRRGVERLRRGFPLVRVDRLGFAVLADSVGRLLRKTERLGLLSLAGTVHGFRQCVDELAVAS